MQILHYTTAAGRAPVRDFIQELPEETRFEVLTLLRRLEQGEVLPMPHSRSLASMAAGLYELRVRDAQGQVRVFYYAKVKQTLFLVHALRKKNKTIPGRDRDLIVKRIKEINQRYRG